MMQRDSFKFYWSLAQQRDPSCGVKTYPMTEYRDDCTDDTRLWFKNLVPGYRVLPASELPSGVTMGVKYTTLAMNPLLLLQWLKKELDRKGVEFMRAEVKSIEEARKLTRAKVIVNASGLGARELVGDEAVRPVRGQTMFVKTNFSELVMREGSEYTYVIPRMGSGGVIMGGVKSDRLDAEVDIELKTDILRRVNRITNDAFKDLDPRSVQDIIGFRPSRKGGLRVERGDVVHAYGVEGAGYIYSFGLAEKARLLIEEDNLKARL